MNIQEIEEAKILISDLTPDVGLVDTFIIQANKFEVREHVTHIITDLDDTLCSRRAQMRNEPLLKENRGAAGNKVVFNTLGAHDFIDKHYKGITLPREILDKLTPENCYILTAGVRILQGLKIDALGLNYLNYRVVDTGIDKILETIYYVLLDLKYIPGTIEIYEDKPHHFLKYRSLIETCLGTKLKVCLVEMDGNQGYENIEEIIQGSKLEKEQIKK